MRQIIKTIQKRIKISMSDEAKVNHEDFINNMKAGYNLLIRNWTKTDYWMVHRSFSKSISNSCSISKEMGFDAWFFSQAHYQDKRKRLDEKSLEF
jgi:hypothetical protein